MEDKINSLTKELKDKEEELNEQMERKNKFEVKQLENYIEDQKIYIMQLEKTMENEIEIKDNKIAHLELLLEEYKNNFQNFQNVSYNC